MSSGAFYLIIDKLVSRLDRCPSAYKELTDLFGVLFMPENMSNSEITKHADALMSAYPSDLNSGFARAPIHFRSFLCAQDRAPSKMLNTVLKLGLQSAFPEVCVCVFLRFSLYHRTNCEGELSFSPMARIIKDKGRKMNQPRLKSLSILPIESDLARGRKSTERRPSHEASAHITMYPNFRSCSQSCNLCVTQ